MKFQEKISQFIQSNQMPAPSSGPVIVGVSGGADSVTLLHLLLQLGYTCIAAHCNFQLRGNDSLRDEEFVLSFAAGLQVPIENIRFDTLAYANQHQVSVEMAARELRYGWFEALRVQYNASGIAVGHHADDAIETVLINLLRGTGISGLTGIQAVNGSIIRPLLCISQQEIQQYIQEHHLAYVTDVTNFSTDIIRNKIRHQLIPLAETINPSFRNTMLETMKHLRESADILTRYFQSVSDSIMTQSEDTVRISIEEFRDHKGSVTLLHHIIKAFRFNSRQTEQIFRALDAEAGKLFYSPTHFLLKDRAELIIKSLNKTQQETTSKVGVRILTREEAFPISIDPDLIHVDANRIQFPLLLRPWKTGDYFFPLGMKNRKKLSDFLTDLKLNRMEKKQVQVLTDASDSIVWVVGQRIDDRYRVSSTTSSIAEIKLKKS